jgi:hypothetical protein
MIQMDVRGAVVAERLAAVIGDMELHAADVDSLIVVGIDTNLAELHGPRIQAVHFTTTLVFGANTPPSRFSTRAMTMFDSCDRYRAVRRCPPAQPLVSFRHVRLRPWS